MSRSQNPDFSEGPFPQDGGRRQPPPLRRREIGLGRALALAGIVLALAYGIYLWFFVRQVVGAGEVLILMKKNGGHSLPGDQMVVPRPPDKKDQAAYAVWEKTYGDCNGILDQFYLSGTYFSFSPFDYERWIVKTVEVPSGKVGIVIKKFGKPLDPGQIIADPGRDQRGPLPDVLQPAQYPQFANHWAYEVKIVDPVQIDPGHRGVVTIMAGKRAGNPNQYLVEDNEQGVQKSVEPEGFRYVNPFVKRITPISIRSQRFEMVGADNIRFPSSDSFEIKMEGFVEWSIIPDKLPLIYVEYGEGGELIKFLDERVILPYSRSFCRLVGSRYSARDFISGDTKLKFQEEYETKLREACAKQGIEILQALVRDIIPPDEIKNPINEREVARQQILTLEQQILVAKSQAALATQTEMGTQNKALGDASTQVVTIVKKAEQSRNVAITKAKQDLEVAKLRLEAAQKQADAIVLKGQAEANVVLLNIRAEADPLRQQVSAFGDGEAYAQYFFYQKIAPSMKSILTNTDGPFADMLKQFSAPRPAAKTGAEKVSGVQP